MISRTTALLSTLLLASGLVACTTTDVVSLEGEPFGSNSLSSAELGQAISRAGESLGWEILEAGPGRMVGTLTVRTHVAVVDIAYDARVFSIRYKDSTNLNHSGSKIHRNYNNWVLRLARAIQEEINPSTAG